MWDRSHVPPEILTIQTPEVGDRSYAIVAGTEAVVLDPQRDIDRVLELLAGRGASVSHVVETHIHNDYVSGAAQLCRVTGVTLVIPAGESVDYPRRSIGDGEEIMLGALRLVARHTPGHT